MADFTKEAELLEEGQSSVFKDDSMLSSPTLTEQSRPCSKSEHSQPPVSDKQRPSWTWPSFWQLMGKLHVIRHDTPPANSDSTKPQNDTHFQSKRQPKQSRPENVVRSLKDFNSGYPNLATFADSDEGFMLYRRFGYVQARVLLEKQDELRRLEEQLDERDRADAIDDFDQLTSRRCYDSERKELMTNLETAYCQYAALLSAAHQLMSFNRPSRGEHRSVVNYLTNEKPVHKTEYQYILRKEDLITLRSRREDSWLDRTIEQLLNTFRCRAAEYLFCSKESRRKASDKSQVFYCRERIERTSTGIITVSILVLLIVPIYLLFSLMERNGGVIGGRANAVCIAILLISTLLFSVVMTLFTAAKKHEVLGAAAGYCAVLVVFLGNVGTTQSNFGSQ